MKYKPAEWEPETPIVHIPCIRISDLSTEYALCGAKLNKVSIGQFLPNCPECLFPFHLAGVLMFDLSLETALLEGILTDE